jgi:hypothetical protein
MACKTRKHGHETLEIMRLPGPHATWTSHAPGSPDLPRGEAGGRRQPPQQHQQSAASAAAELV